MSKEEPRPTKNTDTHLFSEVESDYYSYSCHMTQDRLLGIDVGGYVKVMSLKDWHQLEQQLAEKEKEIANAKQTIEDLEEAERLYLRQWVKTTKSITEMEKRIKELEEQLNQKT